MLMYSMNTCSIHGECIYLAVNNDFSIVVELVVAGSLGGISAIL